MAILGLGCGDPGTPSRAEEPGDALAEALACFRRPQRAEPLDPRTIEAQRRIAAGEYRAALGLLDEVLRDAPDAGRPRFLLGLVHHKQKRYAEAKSHFERALHAGPAFDGAHAVFYFYGWCAWYLGELDGARRAFEATLELDPKERDAHYGLGLIALEQGRIDDAEGHLRESIALAERLAGASPANAGLAGTLAQDVAKARARLADVELARDRPEAARAELEECVRLHPAAYEAWFKLSRVLARLGDQAGAARALEQHQQWKRRAGR